MSDLRPATGHTAARQWVIELPWATPPVKPNGGHGNIHAHAAKVKRTRQTMGILARNAKIPTMAQCRVELTWFVADKRRRDVDNLAWTLKPLCDALAGTRPWDHRIVEDDTPEFMDKPMPSIVYEPGGVKRMTVTITELTLT